MMQTTEDGVFVCDAMGEFFPDRAIEDLTTSELSFLLMQAIRRKREREAPDGHVQREPVSKTETHRPGR